MNYTDLREGDHLPMVGALQQLLNSTGASLAPDGICGRRTLAAVKAFQRVRGLVQDGIVGEETWGRLAAGMSLPILDTIDVWDPTFLSEDATYIQQAKGNPLLIGGMCNGVEQAVSLLAGSRNVFLLRFHGHGSAGGAGVGRGHGELDPDWEERSRIWADPEILDTLSRLRSIFGPYGCVEFISCETGRGPKGLNLLSQLAARLDVPVTAAKLSQPFGKLWSFRLFGPTVTAVPGGVSLSQWCRSLPGFAGRSAA